jgi:undecaprenyl-diphosphatase
MALWRIGETRLDRKVADAVVEHANPVLEQCCHVLTWAADERLLYGVTAGLWLLSRRGTKRERHRADHLAVSVLVAALLPHVMKRLIDQQRPDRCMVPPGLRHGIPRSGKPLDAFPSGHAMHIGAVVSAVSRALPKAASLAWGLGGLIAATRIILLAHWTTDVLAGLAMGAGIERGLWSLRVKARGRDMRGRTPAKSGHGAPPDASVRRRAAAEPGD